MRLLIKTIIYYGLKNQAKFVRLLAKLEYGVSACLVNLSKQAIKDGYPNLSKMLRSHASEERNHGRMLATLVDGKQRIELRGNGRWLSLVKEGQEIANHPEKGTGKVVACDNAVGIFDNLDGISRRYLALRVLLRGKKIEELSWGDRLACMHVLEEGTLKFYNVLAESDSVPIELRAIALKIAGEEAGHSNYLKYSLSHFTHISSAEISEWRSRVFWAQFGLIWDFWKWHQTSK
jgi:predicted metal-dependent hydrolase